MTKSSYISTRSILTVSLCAVVGLSPILPNHQNERKRERERREKQNKIPSSQFNAVLLLPSVTTSEEIGA